VCCCVCWHSQLRPSITLTNAAGLFRFLSCHANDCIGNTDWCVRMFGSIVQRLQSLSPLGSPVTSPVSSPKPYRRRFKSPTRAPKRHPAARHKEEYREVQSDPELDETDTSKTFGRTSHHLLDKRKNKSRVSARTEPGINNNMYADRSGFAPLQGSKSLGRLDGLKEVGNSFD
jgi:hypothetical protein